MVIPAFIIHNPSSSERTEIVKELMLKTKGMIVQAILLPDGVEGCRQSHSAVARLARSLYPLQHYLVFEDDCVLSEDWERCLEGMEMADVLYLGYNDKCEKATFGTHALMISPKARDKILAESDSLAKIVERKNAMDWILSKLCRQEGLLTAMPPLDEKERWAWQKRGIKSLITGQIR
jgi:hypothetical protein